MPVISVIVPVYNVEKYLHRCVDSILAQTFTDFELILVDDGSPDNCGKICDEYADKDKRITVIHTKNEGPSVARNIGIDFVLQQDQIKWVNFIDSDDWVHEKYLEVLYNAAESNNVRLSVCPLFETFEDSIPDVSGASVVKIKPNEFYSEFAEHSVCPVGKLYEKSLFLTNRFPVGKLCEDVFFSYKVIFSVEELVFIDSPYYAYFQSPSSRMRSQWTRKRLAALDAFNEQIQFFKVNNYAKSYRRAIIAYANDVEKQISVCEKYGSEDKNAINMLRKLLRQHLRKYRREKIFSLHNTSHYYDYAYPNRMYIFWSIKAQLNKLKGEKNARS